MFKLSFKHAAKATRIIYIYIYIPSYTHRVEFGYNNIGSRDTSSIASVGECVFFTYTHTHTHTHTHTVEHFITTSVYETPRL
jgi:hypothetical protein